MHFRRIFLFVLLALVLSSSIVFAQTTPAVSHKDPQKEIGEPGPHVVIAPDRTEDTIRKTFFRAFEMQGAWDFKPGRLYYGTATNGYEVWKLTINTEPVVAKYTVLLFRWNNVALYKRKEGLRFGLKVPQEEEEMIVTVVRTRTVPTRKPRTEWYHLPPGLYGNRYGNRFGGFGTRPFGPGFQNQRFRYRYGGY